MALDNIKPIAVALREAARRKHRRDKTSFVTLLAAGALLAFFAFFLLDYATRFPRPVRVVLTAGIVGTFAGVLPRRWRSRFTPGTDITAIAREVEAKVEGLKPGGFLSVLVSAVEFALRPDIFGSEMLKEEVVRQAHKPGFSPLEVPLHSARLLHLARRLAMATAVVYIGWAALGVNSLGVFVLRAVGREAEYLTRTRFVRIECPPVAAQSRDVPLSVEVAGVIPLKGTAEVRFKGEQPFELDLGPAGQKTVFKGAVRAPTADFSVVFRAGDARSREYAVRVRKPPYAKDGFVTITPPAYTREAERRQPFSNVEAVENSLLAVTVWPDREVTVCALVAGGAEHAMAREGDGFQIKGIRLQKGGRYSIRLVDREGIEDDGRISYALTVIKDQLPLVVLESPGADTYYSPVSKVPWVLKASDDYGVSNAVIRFEIGRENERGELDVLGRGEWPAGALDGDKELTRSGRITLADIGAPPGTSVALRGAVKDFCGFREKDAAGESPVRTVHVVTPEELRAIILEEQRRLGKLIDDVATSMERQARIIQMQEALP